MAETTKTFYVWVIAGRDEFAESLVAKLVRRGFTVGPLGRQLITKHEDNPAVVVAFTVHRIPRNEAERREYTPLGLHTEVTDVIKVIKGKFWGMVVSSSGDCTWNVGNMSILEEVKEHVNTAKKVN